MSNTIENLLRGARRANASDLFITAGLTPMQRSGGTLAPLPVPPVSAAEIDAFRKSIVNSSGEDDYLRSGSCDAAYSPLPGERFRLNFFSTVNGPALAVRPLSAGGDLFFDKLNLPPVIQQVSESPRGIILVTGSTGSGKSTTLAAMVNHINRNFSRHIITIEDPVEFIHSNLRSMVNQRQLDRDTDSFEEALRSALRENPDVIVVGEMRDAETMSVTLSAALTGHLVIATMHTADAVQSVERMINQFPEHRREQVAIDLGMSLLAVFSQRLLPRSDGTGMIPAVEVLIGTPSVRNFIERRDYAGVEDLLRRGSEDGMITFNRAIFRMYRSGLVALKDARAAVDSIDEFDLLVKGMEGGVDAFRNHYGDHLDFEDGHFVDMRNLLYSAMKLGASDLMLSVNAAPTLRINGVLRALDLPPLSSGDVQRLLFSVITPHQRVEFEEKRELDFALSTTLESSKKKSRKESEEEPPKPHRFRINGFYQRGTIGVVARVVANRIPPPEELGLPPRLLELTGKQQGLILVTGPTGSGKSTTLACLIDQINRHRSSHIITIEDPIEYVHENIESLIEQRELHSDTMSFATALKYALRQAPDVIMVGEMRDVDTMAAALTAAETGHLVFATVHTNSAPQTIDRIIDSFPQAHQNQIRAQLSAVILAVVSQRLLPRVDGKGRVAAFELMIGTPPVQSVIREGKTHQLPSVMETSAKDGMVTLEKALEELYGAGMIAIEDMKRLQVEYRMSKPF